MEDQKHVWVAELQDDKGNAVAYHSFELDPKHYPSSKKWNEAHKSWSCHRQRERKNLACNRDAKCTAPFAVSWLPRDHAFFLIDPPQITHHATIWDLYRAIRYDYKRQCYLGPDEDMVL